MGVKSTQINKSDKTLSYPYIGVAKTGLAVLFLTERKGFVVDSGKLQSIEVGYFADNWDVKEFFRLEGSITLENT